MLSPLFWLSCYIFRTTTGTTYTTKYVVSVVLVVVLYFRTTTGTTCTTSKVVPVVLVVVYILDDNLNNLYNKVCGLRCSGCRIIFLGRQLEQLIQQSMWSPLFWLSCIFQNDNGNNLYNKQSCLRCSGCRIIFSGRQQEQLIQQSMLSPLFWLSYYIFRTTTGTTCTTKNVVSVVLVVVLYFQDDNRNNLYNQESCPRCYCCRVYFWTTT